MKRSILLVVLFIASYAHGQGLEQIVYAFSADKAALERKYPFYEDHERYKRMERFYSECSDRLKAIQWQTLSQDGKVDYLLLKNQIAKESFRLKRDFADYREVAHVIEMTEPVQRFIKQRRNGDVIDSKKLAADLSLCTAAMVEKMKRLSTEKPFDHWRKAQKAAGLVDEMVGALKEAHEFYNHYDPAYSWWVSAPYTELIETSKKYRDFLQNHFANTVKDDGSGIIGKPIGREALLQELKLEFIPYSPEELISYAEKELRWCEQEMVKAASAMGFGKDWKAAIEKVKTMTVDPGHQPALVKTLAEEAIAFVEERDLITVPPLAKEVWRMKMMSPERQKINPFFLGGEEIIISYPTSDMAHDLKMMSMRGNNPYFSKSTVHHELIPGHHLQDFMVQRYKPHRQAFDTPFWIEGWALYWEMNLWDKGFATTPEEKVGMLFWRMHRCARIIFSLSFHLEKMTPLQCIDLLVNRVGHERANAEAEVRRSFTGLYGPLYQIAYMVGGLQFRSLKSEFMTQYKASEKDFHDRVLQEGSIPVELLRLILLKKEFGADYATSWKFLN